jgi:hypothetical protein
MARLRNSNFYPQRKRNYEIQRRWLTDDPNAQVDSHLVSRRLVLGVNLNGQHALDAWFTAQRL